jgi:hypothetical protein
VLGGVNGPVTPKSTVMTAQPLVPGNLAASEVQREIAVTEVGQSKVVSITSSDPKSVEPAEAFRAMRASSADPEASLSTKA